MLDGMTTERADHPVSPLRLIWSRPAQTALLHVYGEVTTDAALSLEKALSEVAGQDATALVVDLTGVTRWTPAGSTALNAGHTAVSGSLAVHVVATDTVLETLRLAGLPDTLTLHPDLDTAFAALAETGELREELAQREQQLATLPVIEQAKGMLMRDFGIGPEEAFGILATISQHTNTKLRDVATNVVDSLLGKVTPQTAELTRETLRKML